MAKISVVSQAGMETHAVGPGAGAAETTRSKACSSGCNPSLRAREFCSDAFQSAGRGGGRGHPSDAQLDGHANPPRRSVLVVTCRLLQRMGHRALGAEDGAAALALIRAEQVDLVLCDVDMLIMPGPALHAVLLTERPDLARRFAFFTGGPLVDPPFGVPVLVKPVAEEVPRETLHSLADSGHADL